MDDLQKPLDEQCIAEANMQNELKAENTEGRNNATGENDNYFGRHLRQIFVTKNPLLCMEVERNFCDLRHASRVGKMHSSSENNPLPPKLQDVDDLQYPLFITFRKLLQFLDKSITDTNQSMLAKNSNLTVRNYELHKFNTFTFSMHVRLVISYVFLFFLEVHLFHFLYYLFFFFFG